MLTASVIMPCFNSAAFLEESIAAVLNQSLGDLELLVVDDASIDGSGQRLQSLAARDRRITLVQHRQNLGASRSRNDGLRMARGKFIAFCDADDIWTTKKLELQVDLLTSNLQFDVTYCDSLIIDELGATTGRRFGELFPLPVEPSGLLVESLCRTNFINMQTVLLRRESFAGDLFFDENIRWVEDWWQWIRLSHKHKFLYDPRPLAKYRIHSQSTAVTQKPGIHRNRWKVCRRALSLRPATSQRCQSILWYQMARSLSLLRKPRWSRAFYWRAIQLNLLGRGSPLALVAMLSRLFAAHFPIPGASRPQGSGHPAHDHAGQSGNCL